ncbi:pecanex-like protein 4 [Littorina saxatilis]|uniref:Pecanex-like protein n=1 Tax=Littorina saxatilis TaxID=31220 RepID=A0AAN9BG63_9CAEN
MGGGVPLLNEYKQEFVWKRLPQTIFGGPKLKIGYDAPAYVYCTQVLLWALPWILGGIFTLVLELAYSSGETTDYLLLYCCLYGACITIFVVVVQTISTVVHIKEKENTKVITKKNFLAEEDEVDFQSCCGAETIEFVVPPKRFKLNILVHGLISGGMCGVTLWYLLPWTLNSLYGDDAGATAVLFLFGWFTLSIAQYSLTAAAPPEPAIFRTMDVYEMSPLSRPFYVLVCLAFHILHWNLEEFKGTNQALHIVFACLPLLWLLGVLPPLEALLLWVAEQVHVFMLGGSPMASNLRLALSVTASTCVFLGAYYIPVCFGTVLLSAAMGYVLSCDLSLLCSAVLQACRANKVSSSQFLHDSTQLRLQQGFGWTWGAPTLLYHLAVLCVTVATAAAVNYKHDSVDGAVVGWVVVGLCVAEKCLRDVQSVFIVFGLFRNYLFPHACLHSNRPYTRRKRQLAVLGIIRRIIFNWGAPVTMVMYLAVKISQPDVMDQAATHGLNTAQAVWYTLGVVRAFRGVWQSTVHSLLEVSVVHVVVTVMGDNSTVQWLGVPTLLLMAGVVRDRGAQLANKLYLFLALLVSSWTDKKQRRGSTALTLFLSLVLFPLVLVVMITAALLSAPLLPLFTLPVFFIAFPRPQRFWPEPVGASANVCGDTVYYRQLAPMLATSLRASFAAGSLGEPHPGNHYLVRYQDRLVWVVVLERGNAYVTLGIKGLELQETSCHTAEAARLDDIFETAFQNENGVSCCEVNQYPMHSLTPVDVCRVKTYSDARNVLTGVIDQPGAVDMTLKFFVKSLVWLVLHHVNKVKVREEAQRLQKEKQKREEKASTKKSLSAAVVTRSESQGSGGRGKGGGNKMEINHNHRVSNFNSGAALNNNAASSLPPPPSLPPIRDSNSLTPISVDTRAKNTFAFPPLEEATQPVGRSMEKTRKSSWSSSINSFTDSLWSDDDLDKPKGKKKSLKPAKVGHSAAQHLTPSVTPVVPKFQHAREKTDYDEFLDDFDFGLPMADVNRPKPNTAGSRGGFLANPLHSSSRVNGNHIYKPVTNLAGSPDFKCQYSSHMSLPAKWRELPIEHSQLSRHMAAFPADWYRHVLSLLDWSATGLPGEKVAIDVGADDALTNCYSQLIMACYSAFDTPDKMFGPSYLYKAYNGDVPWNAMLDWLSEDKELFAIVTKAFRLGFKLMLDAALLGDIEEHEELEESLREFDSQWYVGMEGDAHWKAAVLENRANLFSLGHNNVQSTYTSRTLTMQDVAVSVGRLNTEAVRGQWANLSLELLFMTNDDEERYSIQAHPTVLRNLTVQAADPPLGYPIFSSQPISVPTL